MSGKGLLDMDMERFTGLLNGAFTDVIRTMTGLDAEEASDCFTVEEDSITGAMAVFGSADMMVTLSTGIDAAKLIVAYMTGVIAADLTLSDIHDGMAELVNMFVGRLKADLVREGLDITITSPFSISGNDVELVFKDRTYCICRYSITDDVGVILRIVNI